ncbi:MAG: penicillin-binding transpeptidase domain-containing protein [Oscillospiraceae bacterium]|nr:penicillin-binding transpeptidase domain-containing protein [Oscillospiraceae bacterium]
MQSLLRLGKAWSQRMKQLSEVPAKYMKVKLWAVAAVLIGFVTYIGSQLYEVAVSSSEYYRAKANNQQLDDFEINANRGAIYDRNGKILAKSTTVWNVVLSPFDIKANDDDPEKISKMLADVLKLDKQEYNDILEKCKDPDKRYEIVKKRISKEQHDEINRIKLEEDIGLYSVYLVEDTMREYPNNALASNLVGFTGHDNTGQYGVESYYDKYLQGRNGRLVMLKDGMGRTMSSEFERRFEAHDGNNLYMTIDVVLQHYLEKNLEIIINQHHVANRATGIMMDPNTGAILAMATTLGYNLNNPTGLSESDEEFLQETKKLLTEEAVAENPYFTGQCERSEPCKVFDKSKGGEDERCSQCKKQYEIVAKVKKEEANLWERQWRNKAITELYYPGSVFKAITAAAALEEKVVSLGTGFYCSGREEIQGVSIGCWQPSGHGSLDLIGAITKSCNPALMDMGKRLGVQRFCDYLDAFGLTQKTGIDLPAEAFPIVRKRNEMSFVDLATSSFGQTNKITPLQMISAFSSCINGGYLVNPHVVDKITDNAGNVVKSNNFGAKRQILSRETSNQMRHILEEVVNANGGSNAYMSGYRIGGKSGTSQKLDEYPEDDSMRYVASFCAFAPADNPKVIMLVVVDEPNPGGQPYYGSMVAAPVVSAVFKESFQHLEIYPQFTAEEQALQDTIVPNLLGLGQLDAGTKLNTVGLELRVIGNGSRVLKTVPVSGAQIRRGSTVVVYMEEKEAQTARVPDVVTNRMTVTQAIQAITDAGLNIRLAGGSIGNENAIAVYMNFEAGEMLEVGTVIDVQFAVNDGHGG